MYRFKQFVSETILQEKDNANLNAQLIYQKLIDAIDHAHIDYSDNKIEFHIGRVIKNSSIHLNMVIRQSFSNSIKLGRNKQTDNLTIVVDTEDKVPQRTQIDDFLTKNRYRANKIKTLIAEYLRTHHVSNIMNHTATQYEDDKNLNHSTQFEGRYETLIKQLNDKIQEFKDIKDDLKKQMNTENIGKRETARAAIKHLAKEYFGDNLDEFKGIVKKLYSKGKDNKNAAFSKNLNIENKKKLEARLNSFYDQKIKPLLKDI